MRRDLRIYRGLLLIAAMLLATIALGWWGVLVAAIAFAVIDRRRSAPGESAVAAALAWLALFIVNVAFPATGIVRVAAEVMGVPVGVLPLLTILFPALLAWSGAVLALAIAHGSRRRPHV